MLIQCNVRVPETARDLMHRLTARLRTDAGFVGQLEALLGPAAPVAAAPVSPQEIGELREKLEALAARVAVLEYARVSSDPPTAPARPAVAKPAAVKPTPAQLDIEDAVKEAADQPADKPKKKAKGPPSAEVKAERKAFAAEIRNAPGAQGLGWTALGNKLAPLAGITVPSCKNILSGSIASSPAVRNKLRVAVGLDPKG